jgi:uncharacterized RDD family membrane protein YckC
MVAALIFFVAPLLLLVTAGVITAARHPRAPWIPVVALLVTSTVVWLGYAGLYQHETPCNGKATGCPTVYGYDAPLPDEHIAGILLLVAGFVVPAVLVGLRRLVPPFTTGASLALGPTVLAGWTAPRGDNDGLWALVLIFLPLLGVLAAGVAAVAERVGAARGGHRSGAHGLAPALPSDRLTALALDVAIAAAVMVVPLTALSHAHLEVVAGGLGVVTATAFLAVPVARKGRTLGQSIVGLNVLDATTHRLIPARRAVLRSLVVVLEVAACPTLVLAIPAVIEWVSLVGSGRTVTDRVFGTAVLSGWQRAESPPTSEQVELA